LLEIALEIIKAGTAYDGGAQAKGTGLAAKLGIPLEKFTQLKAELKKKERDYVGEVQVALHDRKLRKIAVEKELEGPKW
jgi:hypothetical protein